MIVSRRLGLDLGDKTIGVAVSDPFGWTAQGVTVIRRTTQTQDLQTLRKIIEEYDVQEIILGYPKNMDGSIGPRAEKSRAYAEWLRETLQLPIVLWDERLTTRSATRTLLEADMSRAKRKLVVDKMAATLLLQTYLDNQSKG
jgi:putative Holliday junction resolvase